MIPIRFMEGQDLFRFDEERQLSPPPYLFLVGSMFTLQTSKNCGKVVLRIEQCFKLCINQRIRSSTTMKRALTKSPVSVSSFRVRLTK